MARNAKRKVVTLNQEYGFTSFHRWMIVNGCTLMTENEREVFKKHFPKSNFDIIPDGRNEDLVRIKGFFDIWELNEYMDRQSCASLHVKMNRVQRAYLEAQLKCKNWDDMKAEAAKPKHRGFVGIDVIQPVNDDLPF
tara:strand:+ start:65 stop:475 length:411 start_codon:yes stop_codon:yes gene_type:complete